MYTDGAGEEVTRSGTACHSSLDKASDMGALSSSPAGLLAIVLSLIGCEFAGCDVLACLYRCSSEEECLREEKCVDGVQI